jgi:uncharacterized protein (TIGR02246 family)
MPLARWRSLHQDALAGVICAITSCAIAVAGCSSSDDFSAADEAAIRAASERYAATTSSGDSEGWGELIAEDAVYMVPGLPVLVGRDAVVEWDSRNPPSSLELTIHEILGRDDLAVVRGSYVVRTEGASGQTMEDRGKYIEVWQRQSDGAWRIARDVWNSELPADRGANSGSATPDLP